MKRNLFKFCLVLFFTWFLWNVDPVLADTATTTIRLQIKTFDSSLYDANIEVAACADSATATTTSINGKCAIEQSGLLSDWSWWGEDVFLNSIDSYINNDAGNGIYWGWFSNLEYGSLALNKHLLTSGEKLLLVYNINPLRISVSSITPFLNAIFTITAEQFGLDSSWNPVWLPAASSTLVIDAQEIENAGGIYEYVAATTTPVLIYGKKIGFLDSEEVTMVAQEQPAPAENNDQNNESPPAAGGAVILPPGGGGGMQITPLAKVDLVKAVDFLTAKQGADGSFGSVLITDWAAIASASFNPSSQASSKIKSHLLIDPDPLIGMNPVSDYARRAMALMSLGISPYGGTKTNYIKKIIDLSDGKQFGDASLYNDDIFALIVLTKAGYTANDKIIQDAAVFIISKQLADGSWGSIDLTAAAIQALKPVLQLDGVNSALEKARNFLFIAQAANGGFGNTFTTAWVMQAIATLGEDPNVWQKNGQKPESYLVLSQGADGGLEKDDSYEVNRIWSTAYAIPAVQGKPWFNVLNSFVKEDIAAGGETALNDPNQIGNLVATSSSGSLDLATSLPEVLEQASTTEITILSKAEDEVETEKQIAEKPAEIIKPIVKPIKTLKPKVLSIKISEPKLELSDEQVKDDQESQTVKAEINNSGKKAWYTAAADKIINGFYLALKLLLSLL